MRKVCRPTMEELLAQLDAHLSALVGGAASTNVNRLRANILNECKQRAIESPGIYSLTVPTGGGKTLSSMAFALTHAHTHKKSRIIYVIPYTSIIEQTANVFRGIFGDQIIEHHSNLDPENETAQSRLACENWDAPIVVTTSVQFFESLFAARTSKVRKLHNIVNGVVVLDEAQLLPPDFLIPILDVIEELSRSFGVTFVLSTATQPALEARRGLDYNFKGLSKVKELIADPIALHEQLRRVEVETPANLTVGRAWEEIANELESYEQVLCIVNSRADCLTLYRLMPKGTVYLSALMCGEHRSKVIADIKASLRQGEPLRVVSTQLVEAGVDLDFPVVYRALAGLDSIAQAAGRCNREGLLSRGRVVVFVPPTPAPAGHLRQAAQCGRQMLSKREGDPLSPESFRTFFELLYWQKGSKLDKEGIIQLLSPNDGLEINFRTAASRFKVIDENAQAPVVVRYGPSTELIEMLRQLGPSRWLLRRLQRFVVNIPRSLHMKLMRDGDVIEVHSGIFVQAYDGLYNEQTGLSTADLTAYDPESLVV
ncbi:MAG TPA: CRISPR-associated helicase Cas3' [Candidatus Obscuribacterales bacterium]